MTSKQKSVKTPCPLCERSCQVGSTDAKFIRSKGVCLRCAFGKSMNQINDLLLAKKTNDDLNAGKSLNIKNFDFSKTKDKGVTVVMNIDKKNCIESIDVAELNSTEIDNSCDCYACQYRKNIERGLLKTPAIFEGYAVNDSFIRNKDASFDGGCDEVVFIKRTWQKPDGSAWVTFLSNQRLGFLDMRLEHFAKKYKAISIEADALNGAVSFTIPMPAPKPIVNNDKQERSERRFFHITFSYFIGGKRGHRKGYTSHRTFNNEMFNIEIVSKEIKKELKAKKIKSINVLIENWKEVNRNEYVQLMRGGK